jgi:hypothetical protein
MAKNIQRVRPQGVVLAHGLWTHGLGLKALGLLYLLLDLAQLQDWEFSVSGLVQLARHHDIGDGQHAISTAIAELEAKGFLRRQRERSEGGQLGGAHWWISDQPIPADGEPEAAEPALENPTLVNRPQQGSSSIEEEKNKKSPSCPPESAEFSQAALELWNRCAPAHWVRIRELGAARQRRLNGLVREFGNSAKALAALEQSLAMAHQEDWCMKPQMRLALENWLSNGKVRQYQEKALALAEPAAAALSGEQQEIAALAEQHPDLFEGVSLQDGCLHLRYSAAVQQRAQYPAHGLVTTVSALEAEIAYLQQRLAPALCPL